MDLQKLKPDNAKAIAIILVVIVVLVIGGYWVSKTFGSISGLIGKIGDGVKGVTDGLGITTPTNVQNAIDANVAANLTSAVAGSPFSYNLYLAAPSGSITDPGTNGGTYTSDIAKQIWNAAGFFSTDGQSMLSAFKGLGSKAQVSYLAYQFNEIYNKDLYDWLGTQLTSNNNQVVLQQIQTYVNSLPNY